MLPPAPITKASDQKRPSDVLLSAVSSLYELFVGLRHERNLTEQDIVDGVKQIAVREKRKSVVFTEDMVDEWQRNKAFPMSNEQWVVACQVLIHENPQTPEGEKQKEVTKYGYAKDESRALFYKTPGKVQSEDFGIFTSRYRRHLKLREDEVAAIFNDRFSRLNRDNVPEENMDALDYQDIARIQIGAQKASPGLIKYLVRALNGEDKTGKALTPLSDEEKDSLETALEKVCAKIAPAKNNAVGESQVTPYARKLRADLIAMFKDGGQQMSQGDIIEWGKTISPTFSYYNVSNYFGVGTTQYGSLSVEKAVEVKAVLGQVLQSVVNDPAKIEEFNQRFDQLTQVHLDYKLEKARRISARPGTAIHSEPGVS